MKSIFQKLIHTFSKKVPTKTFKEIINFEKIKINVELANLTSRDGNVSDVELFYIAVFVQYFDPEKIFEIGTFDGNTTLQMAVNANDKSEIFTLDIKPEEINTLWLPIEEKEKKFITKQSIRVGEKFIDTKHRKKIKQLWGDSAKFDFSPYYGKIDFIFIDGSHSYDYIQNDSDEALKMIRKKGVILWHDYHKDWPGVVRFLNNLSKRINLVCIRGTSLVYYKKENL